MTDELMNALSKGVEEASQTDLALITTLAEQQTVLEGRVDILETLLKAAKKDLRAIQEGKLPTAMDEVGMKTFELIDGRSVEIKSDMKINVPKKRKGDIIEKVRGMGHGDLIKNRIIIDIGPGKDNVAQEVARYASELGVEAEQEEDINSMSLKKVLKDRKEAGKDDDLSFFGAFDFKQAIIKE